MDQLYQSVSLDRVPCSDVSTWIRIAPADGAGLWLPLSQRDILNAVDRLAVLSRAVGLSDGDTVLILTHPPPFPSCVIPTLFTYAQRLRTGLDVEVLPFSLDMPALIDRWMDFYARRRPTVLISDHGDALKLAARDFPMDELRLLLLYGDSARGKDMRDFYGVPMHRICNSDVLLYNAECKAHRGLHVWSDASVSEVIPQDPFEREMLGSVSECVFLEDSEPGLQGELVVTTFGDALPLVRYRTGNMIEVTATERCSCGRSDPRIRLL